MSDDLHHGPQSFWSKYVFSTDHKVIGIQFLFTSILFVILGGALALGVRYQIAWPQQDLPYAEILPGVGPDRERHPDAPKMTEFASEPNVALWAMDHEVTLAENVVSYKGAFMPEADLAKVIKAEEGLADSDEDKKLLDEKVAAALKDARRLPAKAAGAFKGFVHGIAAELPVGTRIKTPDSEPRDVTEPLTVFVDRLSVMAGYKSTEANIQVLSGRVVHEIVDGKPDLDRPIELMGRTVYLAGSTAGVPRIEDKMVLPTKGALTLVKVEVPAGTVKVTAKEQLAGFGLTDKQVDDYAKQLADIKAGNDKIDAERKKALEPLNTRLAEATEKHGKDSRQVKAVEAEIAETNLAFMKKTTKVAVQVPIEAASIASIAAGKLTYSKQSLTSDGYATLFTMHASLMIFFVIIPSLVGAFGNFLIPLMIGARDMAFPKLNALSFWLGFPSGVIMLVSFWTTGGASGGGWTMYPTLSTASFSSQLGTTLWLVSVFLVGFSSIVGSLNYITTTINMRAPGMSMFRMPLTVWSIFITALLQVFATPMLAAAGIMLVLDRTLGTNFFTPDLGGQPLLWQHLFWFYSHPAVYIMILPAMGITSDVLSVYARKPIFGYKPMVYAMAGITGLGFIVWGHHMFQSGMNPVLGTTFMATTIMIAVPSAIKTFNWLGTLWGGDIRFTPAMLWALGFVAMFTIGGLSGIFMAAAPVDIPIHDTYFIVAHIHYVLFGGSIMGIFAGVYHWFPKMFGTHLDKRWSYIHFFMTFIALNGTFFLMHNLGIGGHPRRYASVLYYPSLEHLQPLNVFMTISAMMLGAAQLPFFFNVFASLPSRLGRAIAAFFLAMLGMPIVVGISAWGHSDPAWFMAWFAGDPQTGHGWFQAFIGKASFWITLIAVCVWMARSYGTGIRITVLLSFIGIVISNEYLPMSVPVGHGFLYAFIITVLTFIVWDIAGVLKAPTQLNRLMWVAFLPVFLAPLLLKQDPYFWLGVPELWAYRWVFMLLAGLVGLGYMVLRQPMPTFGIKSSENPWNANSLEWITSSPPLAHGNFETIPTVYRGPYEYSSPVVDEDYLPQTEELPPGIVEPAAH